VCEALIKEGTIKGVAALMQGAEAPPSFAAATESVL